MARLSALCLTLACWLGVLPVASGQNDATTHPVQEIPTWAVDASLALTLTTSGDASPLQYTVIPLTPAVGLNESNTALRTINIVGNLIAADATNYKIINDSRDVAYLSCDENNGPMTPDDLLRNLMEVKPTPIKAILLYSTTANWCGIDYTFGNLVYGSIFTMADAAEAGKALSFLNDTDNGEIVKANIYGNVTEGPANAGPGSHSVAMSVLYSITGVITLLFVIIIAVGAVRAHRHPERYGPRRGEGGRIRQSRARGIARAVLDTIPIVKFGSPSDPKPDLDVELDNHTTNDGQDDNTRSAATQASNIREAGSGTSDAGRGSPATESQGAINNNSMDSSSDATEHPGCSICTEDFTIGEDVRVLPCNHQFHPACIDPWLINVAGTCPLCRYNLNPRGQDDERQTRTPGQAPRSRRSTASTRSENQNSEDTLAPPLGDDTEGSSVFSRNRLSRYFDINRLRNAPVEERMAALRQLRAEEASQSSQSVDGEERHRRARFTERLRETFRVRTRAQSIQREAQT